MALVRSRALRPTGSSIQGVATCSRLERMTGTDQPTISASTRARFRGCLLAGAVGDALGAPVEFLSDAQIRSQFGKGGIRDFASAYGRVGAVTDDTQMTLFTAEGLIRAYVRWSTRGICSISGVVTRAYLRWLSTQGIDHPESDARPDGWLIGVQELHAQRAPGRTCIQALGAMRGLAAAVNTSKGCGGVMRVAPVGMLAVGGLQAGALGTASIDPFELAAEIAGITHGHPTGQLASGLFADIIARVLRDVPLDVAVQQGLARLREHPDHEETSSLVTRACGVAAKAGDHQGIPDVLGEGWVAEEALAIAIYAALAAPDLESAIILAVNHSGDSDSTGSIAGNLLGAVHGEQVIPARWLAALELREEIVQLADDMAAIWFADLDNANELGRWWERYPGG